MEKYQEHREKAIRNMQIADHMLSVTFPMLKEPKLLLAITDNIFLAYTNSIAALLHFERLYKKIPPFNETFESKFNMFKEYCVDRYKIDRSYIVEIQSIKELLMEHKKSPIEFNKGESFIICSENYRIKSLSSNDVKRYISKAKVFIELVDNILGENGRRSNRSS